MNEFLGMAVLVYFRPEAGIAAKRFEFFDPVGQGVFADLITILSFNQFDAIGFGVPEIIVANAVEHGFEWVLLALQYFGGEGFSAVFAEIELDGFMLGATPAAFYDLAALTKVAALDLAVEIALLAGPRDVVGGF